MSAPRLGGAETDPAAWWLATQNAVKSLSAAHLRAIYTIGVAGQMHGVVLTAQDGQALRPAILWPEARSTDQVARYRRLQPDLLHRPAHPPAPRLARPTLLS